MTDESGMRPVMLDPLEQTMVEAMRRVPDAARDAIVTRDWLGATLALLTKPAGADLLREVAKQLDHDRVGDRRVEREIVLRGLAFGETSMAEALDALERIR